ncbi:sugar ABC transporter substrate-binding protein [Rhizobium miluonense]|uniref:Ribose transport system substrate-binding protein n=1 Tax=Rhizobium miluonense TaxID=411945 RepID=A0A1C3V775_9HYPH|nr:sugar ABC transporter substrate-binding protein [Rhizobium miluonense]SCB23489.1 ribose transport system substrate-binding protein [Rhizobium miluonense]
MTKKRMEMTRRQLAQSLAALGLTAASASSIAGVWGSKAFAKDARYKIAFANLTEAAELFVQLGDGIEAAAEKAKIELRRYDNKFDSQTTLRNAQLMVQDQPNLILEYNGVEGIGPALERVFQTASIPFIAINVTVPGGHWFNLVNKDLGSDTARAVVKVAQKKGWSADDTTVIIAQSAGAGDEVNDCVRYFYITAAELMGMPAVAPGDINPLTTTISKNGIQVDGKGALEASYTAVKNVIQTLPQDRKILVYAVNDDSAIGAWRALQEAGRAENTLVAGLGGSSAALKELRTNPSWVAEGSTFVSQWGQFLIAMAVAILEGAQPPKLTKCPQVVLTPENINTFYTADDKIIQLPPLDDTNGYLAKAGVLQLFNNVQGLK